MAHTLFKHANYDLGLLVDLIEQGQIGLPDLQRPFVWKDAKVRDLFDSMYRGYPVGYLLLWQNALADGARGIGAHEKQKIPQLLIVDGQQRLTSMFAVVTGRPVVREDFSSEEIEIAFNPLTERFEVADAAIRKDKAFLPNISAVLRKDADIFAIAESYLSGLGAARDVADDEKRRAQQSIARLAQLRAFPFTALELAVGISEEQVAEVFVRINSQGKPLNQSDFILTLMSVFWDEGREQLERFCRLARTPPESGPSPANPFISPSPDQLLRVAVGLGFKRARLQHVYSILRGKDLQTGEFSRERRVEQFAVLKKAQSTALNLQYWHDFFNTVRQAGYRRGNTIGSETALMFAYELYVTGRNEFQIPEHELRRAIARWVFMSLLTGRYSGNQEGMMEYDHANLRTTTTGAQFVTVLDAACAAVLTSDFWSITLPSDLANAAPRSPAMFAYFAALVLLDARVLFSEQKVADLLGPGSRGPRSAVERHHLFPRKHLKALGITGTRDINQVANYALVEWGENTKIAHRSPAEYFPTLSARFSPPVLRQMHYWHALPDGWHEMDYRTFLEKRRENMARVIADGYDLLRDDRPVAVHAPVGTFVTQGETTGQEFKSTLRVNLHTQQPDPRMELGCLKTIAGFLNHNGGRLIIGVADDGTPVGIGEDRFASEDKMHQHLVNLIKERVGAPFMMYVHPHFDDYQGTRVLVVECAPGRSPVFVKDGAEQRFYVRSGVTTLELAGTQAQEFIRQRFGNR
jgi:hypothetical protein